MNGRVKLADNATLLVLTATYGDGVAPDSARKFITNLPNITGGARYAVLGFGDKSFGNYCAFAKECNRALAQTGRTEILPLADVNRRSSQAFTAWGRALAPALSLPDMELVYTPKRPKTQQLVLFHIERFQSAGAPAAIMRFKPAGRFHRYQAGDLLAVVPPSEPVERYYSLGSSKSDGYVELCVVQVEGGVCSTHLIGLEIGDTIDAFVSPNLDFRPAAKAPTIMIGAGTGVAPFAGMIRHNTHQKMTLYQGIRHPEQDHYFACDISAWCKGGQLRGYHPAFSRHDGKTYVQDLLRKNASDIAQDLQVGGIVMVCGSLAMASAVATEIDIIAQTTGSSLADMRQGGRYLEDIY